ncbi:MAG: hypothetical protein AAGJ35_01445, partial [Myxococcota bacterium]
MFSWMDWLTKKRSALASSSTQMHALRVQIELWEQSLFPMNGVLGLLRAAMDLRQREEDVLSEHVEMAMQSIQYAAQPLVLALLEQAQHTELSHDYVLRQLYQQLMALKQALLQQGEALFLEAIQSLPEEQQPKLKTFLRQSVEGLQYVAIAQEERNQYQALLEMREKPLPYLCKTSADETSA